MPSAMTACTRSPIRRARIPRRQRWRTPIPEEEKSRRLAILNHRQRQIQAERNEKLIGQTFEVLVDAFHASRNQWGGRTSCNRVVNFTATAENLLGRYVSVKVTRGGPASISGEQTN